MTADTTKAGAFDFPGDCSTTATVYEACNGIPPYTKSLRSLKRRCLGMTDDRS